ncbi:hypothetical protein GCM10025870_11000 [Agromyces marinus]|uniref:Uncharacterized protein n=1 Tax=Agromyces marinus TaxID=1389020 RepID=A0ABM8GZU9_9MICO|nr:hypothetical protein GCM10025870_11000 [Agromyces marinus]
MGAHRRDLDLLLAVDRDAAALGDRGPDDVDRGGEQPVVILRAERRSMRHRRDPGCVQDLVGVRVADAREGLLLLQDGLDLLAAPRERAIEVGAGEPRVGRVGAEPGDRGNLDGLVDDPPAQRHPSAGVGQLERGPLVELDHDEGGRRRLRLSLIRRRAGFGLR